MVEALAAEGYQRRDSQHQATPDWHIYADMFPITLKTGTVPMTNLLPYGRVEEEPLTTAVASARWRETSLHAWGGIGINQWYSPTDCDRIAHGINKVLSQPIAALR